MVASSLTTKGIDDVLLRLELLPGKPMRSVLRKAIRAQTGVIRKAVKRNTPRVTGALRRAIGSKVFTTKRKMVVGIVGARRGDQFVTTDNKGRKRNPVLYIHLIELGTEHSAPVGMLRIGLNSTLGGQKTAFILKAKPELDKQVRNLRRKRASSIVSGAGSIAARIAGAF